LITFITIIIILQYSDNKHGECVTEINGGVREREKEKEEIAAIYSF